MARHPCARVLLAVLVCPTSAVAVADPLPIRPSAASTSPGADATTVEEWPGEPVELSLHLPGEAAPPKKWLEQQLEQAAIAFAAANMRFTVAGQTTSEAQPSIVRTVAERHALARRAPRDGRIHLFLVERLADKDRKGGWLGGVHWRYKGKKRSYRHRRYIIVSWTGAAPSTLAHELGHFFGLRHTEDKKNLMTAPGRDSDARFSESQLKSIRKRFERLEKRAAPSLAPPV